MDHNVVLDYAGFGGHTRLTCYSCEGKTLLRQPYMSDTAWRLAVAQYAQDHPCRPARREAYRWRLWATMGAATHPLNYVGKPGLALRDGRIVSIQQPMDGRPALFVVTIEAEDATILEIPCADIVAVAYALNEREVGTTLP